MKVLERRGYTCSIVFLDVKKKSSSRVSYVARDQPENALLVDYCISTQNKTCTNIRGTLAQIIDGYTNSIQNLPISADIKIIF